MSGHNFNGHVQHTGHASRGTLRHEIEPGPRGTMVYVPGLRGSKARTGLEHMIADILSRSRLIALVCGAALAFAGCAQKPVTPESANLTSVDGRVPAPPGSKRDFAQNVGDIVYFSTDSADLSPEAQQTLAKQVQWLGQYPKYTITLEGHADERGTREYNIALGARRAAAVRNFLARSGVDSRRIRTISFGKERPVAVCNDISCWSQNRRAQTILNSRAGS